MKYDYSGVEPGKIASPAQWLTKSWNWPGTNVPGILRITDSVLTFTGQDGTVHLRAQPDDIDGVYFRYNGTAPVGYWIEVVPVDDIGEKLIFHMPYYLRPKNMRPEYYDSTWRKAFIDAGYNVVETPIWMYMLIILIFVGSLAGMSLLILFFLHTFSY